MAASLWLPKGDIVTVVEHQHSSPPTTAPLHTLVFLGIQQDGDCSPAPS